MDIKIILSFVIFGCLWIVDGCNRSPTNICSDRTKCTQRVQRSLQEQNNRKQRSIERNGNYLSIKLQADPCNFNTYDTDLNGEISMGELQAIIGISEEVDDLFSGLDIKKEDGVIQPDEFYEMAPLVILECFNPNK